MRIFVTKENTVLPFNMRLNTLESDIPLSAEVVETLEKIPGLDGSIQTEVSRDPIPFYLVLRSMESASPEEKDSLITQVTDFWVRAVEEYQELHFERRKRTYFVKAVGLPEKPAEYADWLEFALPLKAHDPYGYQDGESQLTGNGMLNNRGNVKTPARIEIAGPATNPAVTVAGVRYAYTGTVPAGQALVVDAKEDTAMMKVLSSGALSNVNINWNGNFLTMRPGNVEAKVAGAAAENFKIFWKNRWG